MDLRLGNQGDRAPLRVGELARRTGLTVRTLHHYDAIGLLAPSLRTPAGHRLYTAADVARLQQIVSLRRLGLSLAEIRAWLLSPGFQPRKAIDSHIAGLREELAVQQALLAHLERIAGRLETGEEVPVDSLIEVIRMTESPMSPEHMALIQELHRETTPEHIREVEQAWVVLFDDVRKAIAAGTDPASPQGREL